MKKIPLLSAIALSGLFYSTANAQIRIGLHINTPVLSVAAQIPVATAYNSSDDYYYLPDVDAYYSVYENCYYYFDGDDWVAAGNLPGEYRNYDWRSARRFEVRAHRPYLNNDVYRERYKGNTGNWSRDDRSHGNANFNNNRHGSFTQPDRTDGNYGRPSQTERDNYGRSSQPSPSGSRGMGNYNQGSQPSPSGSRGMGNYNQSGQPSQQQQGWGQDQQPARHSGNDSQRGNGAGAQHFADSQNRSGHDRFRS